MKIKNYKHDVILLLQSLYNYISEINNTKITDEYKLLYNISLYLLDHNIKIDEISYYEIKYYLDNVKYDFEYPLDSIELVKFNDVDYIYLRHIKKIKAAIISSRGEVGLTKLLVYDYYRNGKLFKPLRDENNKTKWDIVGMLYSSNLELEQIEIADNIGTSKQYVHSSLIRHNYVKDRAELVKWMFNEKGFLILDELDDNISIYDDIKVKCSKNHTHIASVSKLRRGKACMDCYELEPRREAFAARGYVLLETKWRGSNTPMKMICPSGHINEIKWGVFKRGSDCGKCVPRIKKLTNEEVIKRVSDNGFTLLDKEYINSTKPIKVKCSEGHVIYKTLSSISSGIGCPICNNHFGSYHVTRAENMKDKWEKINSVVYIIKLSDDVEDFYKIGISSSLKSRMYDFPYKVTILETIETNAYEACFIEDELLEHHEPFSYKPKKKFGGHTECFSEIDIEKINKYL